MLKTVVTAAIILSAAAALPAMAAETETFTRDGQTFIYSKVVSKNRVVVHGSDSSGQTFYLTIVGKRVTGVSNDIPVSFVMPARRAAPTQLAAN